MMISLEGRGGMGWVGMGAHKATLRGTTVLSAQPTNLTNLLPILSFMNGGEWSAYDTRAGSGAPHSS